MQKHSFPSLRRPELGDPRPGHRIPAARRRQRPALPLPPLLPAVPGRARLQLLHAVPARSLPEAARRPAGQQEEAPAGVPGLRGRPHGARGGEAGAHGAAATEWGPAEGPEGHRLRDRTRVRERQDPLAGVRGREPAQGEAF